MTTEPRISVILPTLNRADLLPRAIGSVLGQTFRDLELLVIDDGSTEDIAAVIAAFNDPRARVIRHPQCLGVAAARNTGLHAARGEYLAFQDSDDEWRLDKLEQQLQQLDSAGPSVGLVISGLLRLRPDGGVWSYPEAALAAAYAQAPLMAAREYAVAFTQTWLLRRTVIEQLGGFDPALRVWEDWDLLLRICDKTGVRLESVPQVVSYITGDSLTADIPQRVLALTRMIEQWQDCGDATFLSRLCYLKARYQLLASQDHGVWVSLRASLRARMTNTKAWLLVLMMLAGAWLPRRYLARRQAGLS
ncbi:MAG: glycosyltransferase family 2 protein [Stenotrophobium sp.]